MTPPDSAAGLSPHPCIDDPACRVRVVTRSGQRALLAAVPIPAGAAVMLFDGDLVDRPSRTSVQVGVGRHIDVGDAVDDLATGRRFVWRFLNHSCDPNAVPHDRVLVARRDIAAGEEVTFDYDANEWHMSAPFPCRCGAAHCRGEIRGFRFLTEAQRRRLAPILSPHVLSMLKNG